MVIQKQPPSPRAQRCPPPQKRCLVSVALRKGTRFSPKGGALKEILALQPVGNAVCAVGIISRTRSAAWQREHGCSASAVPCWRVIPGLLEHALLLDVVECPICERENNGSCKVVVLLMSSLEEGPYRSANHLLTCY